MVEEIRGAVADTASAVGRGMALENPFQAFMLVCIAALTAWFVWSNHGLTQQLTNARVAEIELAHKRQDVSKALEERIASIEETSSKVRLVIMDEIQELKDSEEREYVSAVGMIESLDEKLDMIIANQQLRTIMPRQQSQGDNR